jgi:hypothetical protein
MRCNLYFLLMNASTEQQIDDLFSIKQEFASKAIGEKRVAEHRNYTILLLCLWMILTKF